MTDFLKGNTPATIYQQLLGVGGAADHAGLTASLKQVFTDDGAGASNASSIKISTTALRVESSNQLRFRDDAIYIYSSGDTILNLVADGEIDLATATVDVNATTSCTIDNTNTSNGVQIGTGVSGMPITLGHSTSETTVADNLTVTGTTAHTGVVTVATGVKLQFVDGNEYLSGDSTNLTLGSSADINLTATSDVNIPANVGITFGDDGEKIEGDGTNLAVASSGALNLTGAANSTWKTTAGLINIDSEASTVEIDGHSGVNIVGNAAEVDITTTGAVDINSAAFTLDGTTLAINGTDDSYFTVNAAGKDLTLSAIGGGTQQLTILSYGTAADAVVIDSRNGGIDILAPGAAAGEDIDIVATGSSVNITSTENAADAIVLSASAGGIDITSSGSAGEDIDITTSSSINLTSTENAASSIYLHANGGTSETILIYANQGTDARSIQLLSDVGGITIDGDTDHGVKIGTNVSGHPISIGHSTSEVTIGDNCTVTGDLTVSGSISYAALTVSHATATVLTLDNQEHSDSDGARDITLKFTGEKGSGASVDDMAQIVVSHDGSASDEKGKIELKTNSGSEGTSPTAALTLSADNTATFSGAIAAGTQNITCGRIDVDNIRFDVSTISTNDTNVDLGISPNGTGGIMMLSTNAPGDYSVSIGNGANADGSYAFAAGRSARAQGNDSVSLGDTNTASGANSVAIGDTNTASSTNSVAIGHSNTSSAKGSIALGYRSKADRDREISYASGYASAAGDTRAAMFHDYDRHAISSSWQNIDSLQGGITLPSDGVACGTTLIVGSTTGAALTIGFKIDWLAENDGGTYAIVQQALTSLDSEDTSIDAQMAISSDKIVAQVTDAAITTTMQWSVSTTLVQHNW